MKAAEKAVMLAGSMEENLKEGILPFWRKYLTDEKNGGFYGKVGADLKPDEESPKSVVLNCRLLWTFSRAYSLYKEEQDRKLAKRAYAYICKYFWDETYGGVYWMVTCKGEIGEPEKRTYGQAFLIYSMAEYYRVFKDANALKMAEGTLRLVNAHLKWDNGGYRDSASRDWQNDGWVNVWIKNRTGAAKLLNSNMHLFEAILALAEIQKDSQEDSRAMESLKEQLKFLLHEAMDQTCGHLKAGMDEDGRRLDGEINFGHDSECSYLLTRAAALTGDKDLTAQAGETAQALMKHVCSEGLDPVNGGMYYISDCITGKVNRAKIWWVQAEGITACFNCFQLTGEEKYLDFAASIWDYTEHNMVNREAGDWDSIGSNPFPDEALKEDEASLQAVFTNGEKAGKGKCPYHNARACFEIMERAAQYIN